MPIKDNLNTVTVGSICYSCGYFASATCPWGNRLKSSALEFRGENTGKCHQYQPIVESWRKDKMMKISAKELTDTQLNMALYRKIMAMSEPEQKEFVGYWSYIYPKDYAEDMADNVNKSKQENTSKGNAPKKTEQKNNDQDNKSYRRSIDKEKNEKVKTWYKNKKKDTGSDGGKNKGKFPEPFKAS